MANAHAVAPQAQLPRSQRIQASFRRFFRWLSSPHVFLGLIMLAVMVYMVIVPLYRMLMTTITYSENDLRYARDAVVGEFTPFHWLRMLTTKIGMMMTLEPLLHSLTISLGATFMAFVIGGSLAWLVVRTDLPGRNADQCPGSDPVHHALLDDCDGLESDVQQRDHGGNTWHVDVLDGNAAAGLAGLWPHPDHHQQRTALLHILFLVCFGSFDVD